MKHSPLDDKRNPPQLEVDEGLDDEELFREAMAEVKPLAGRTTEQTHSVRRAEQQRNKRVIENGSDIILPKDLLEDFLQHGEMEGFYQAGYVEGGPQEWNRLLVKKLREGEFSVQAELDLHGLSQRDARTEIKKFIEECSQRSLTCVRIIHGKGKNSRNYVSVLKKQIPLWLSQKSMARHVVAYTSARGVDGGVGAVYVLLQKKQEKKG